MNERLKLALIGVGTILAFAFASFSLFQVAQTTKSVQELGEKNALNVAAVNKFLCVGIAGPWEARNRILDGLVQSSAALVKSRPNPIPGDKEFLRRAAQYHKILHKEFRFPNAACRATH